MKKITFLMLFFSTFWSYSQVKNYTFTQSNGIYTEVTGGTQLGTALNDYQRFVTNTSGGATAAGAGFDIGFNFVYNGFAYDRFAVATDGWIALGTSTLTPSVYTNATSVFSPLNSTLAITPEVLSTKISALGIDLAGQTGATLLYKTTGTSPNQVLTVQWKKYRKNLAGGSFDFQIKLYETSNKIEFVYGTMTSTASSSSYQVGLRAEPSATASNFINRTSQTGWDVTAGGTSASDTVLMNSVLVPASGVTFTWTPGTCGSARNLVTSEITAYSATLNWDYYTPKPTGYEYVVTTSSTLPTGSGTAITATTISLTDLNPDTGYNVFMRSVCDSEYSKWALEGTFRTKCIALSAFSENFDLYGSGLGFMPYCWTKAGNGDVYIPSGGSSYAVSPPYALYMSAHGSGSATVAYAIMPKSNALQADTHRLKFKVYPLTLGGILEVGYFTDINDVNSFVPLKVIELPTEEAATSASEYVIAPKSIPAGVQSLGFKNGGLSNGYTSLYIDDVIWEPIPTCKDVKEIVVNGVLSTSAKLKWTPTGTETAWQYVYGPSTVTDPSTLTMTPVDVTTTAQANLSGLSTVTSYKLWVRSKCADGLYGIWIGPVDFKTTCTPVTEFVKNFDTSGSFFPSCWEKISLGNTAMIHPASNQSTVPSAPNTLRMEGASAASKAVVAMEPVSNSGAGTHRFRFKLRGETIGATVEVGYLKDIDDADSFVAVQAYAASSTTEYDNIITSLGIAPTTPYLAFRVPGYPSSIVYIDDVVWEPIPTCPEISALDFTSFTSNSVNISWTTSGKESQWQYAVGPVTTTVPHDLTAMDFAEAPFSYEKNVSATIGTLDPATSYKIWVRSKCNTSFGAWIGPLTIKTTCAPVAAFIQNFDAATALPSCWSLVGTGGGASVTASTVSQPSAPNVLSIYSASTFSTGIVAMAPLSNADAGTHRLRFKFRGSHTDAVLEVGYLMNVNDPATFNPLKSFTSSSTTAYTEAIADLGLDPASQFLAFRNTGHPQGNIYIDDVVWEPIPACIDVVALNANAVGSTSVDLAWIAGGSEKAWQYAIGKSSDNDPSTLSSFNVTASEIKVSGLEPSTPYRIWVRSKCGTAKFGAWVGSVNFTTTCIPSTGFAQDFDSTTNIPQCWTRVGTTGNVEVRAAADAPSYPDVMAIESSSAASKGIVALPPVNFAAEGTYKVRFKIRGSVVGANLQVGYLMNPSEPNSFITIKSFTAASATLFNEVSFTLEQPISWPTLAFRNTGAPASTIFIDDVNVSDMLLGTDSFDEINFAYYPNPVRDVLNLSFNQEITNVSVLNLLGQQVINQSANENQIKVDLSGLSNGAYLVKVTAGNQSKTIKVIKE